MAIQVFKDSIHFNNDNNLTQNVQGADLLQLPTEILTQIANYILSSNKNHFTLMKHLNYLVKGFGETCILTFKLINNKAFQKTIHNARLSAKVIITDPKCPDIRNIQDGYGNPIMTQVIKRRRGIRQSSQLANHVDKN